MNEQLPAQVVNKLLDGHNVRVAIAEHPVNGKKASCVPVMDYAEVFSYDRESIRRMIERTSWLKRYSLSVIMTDRQGQFRPHNCIFEEAALGVFMKLQPKRCKDPNVAAKVDKLQEELILILRDALCGYQKRHDEEFIARFPFLKDGSAMVKLVDKAYKGNPLACSVLEEYFDIPANKILKRAERQLPIKFPNSSDGQ